MATKIIAILGGWMEKDAEGLWHSTGFDNLEDHHGAPGGSLRVEAGCILYKENRSLVIVVLGGKGKLKDVPGVPPLAEVIARELIELGIPKDKIIKESASHSTYGQLQVLKRIAVELRASSITIVSNRYHLYRIKAMIEHILELKEIADKYELKIRSAEDILLDNNPEKWKKYLEGIYNRIEMTELQEKEKTGAKQIREGTYELK